MAINVTPQEIALGSFLRRKSEELLFHMTMYNTITKYLKSSDDNDGLADLDDILTYCHAKITKMVDNAADGDNDTRTRGGSIKLKKNKTRKRK
jgi:hypothetical protein